MPHKSQYNIYSLYIMDSSTNRYSYTNYTGKPYIHYHSFPVKQNNSAFIQNDRTIVASNNQCDNQIHPHNANSQLYNTPLNNFYSRLSK